METVQIFHWLLYRSLTRFATSILNVTRLSPGMSGFGPLKDLATVKFDIFDIGVVTKLV